MPIKKTYNCGKIKSKTNNNSKHITKYFKPDDGIINSFEYYKNQMKEFINFDIEKYKKISNKNSFIELHIGFGTSLFIRNKNKFDAIYIDNYNQSKNILDTFLDDLIEDDIAKYLK